MPDLATPNLPSRDFDATQRFYAKIGFDCGYRDTGWMILHRGPKGSRVILEFFPHRDLVPTESWFSACIRFDDLSRFVDAVREANVPVGEREIPRLHLPQTEDSGLTIAYLVDPDGSLLRLIQNED